MIVVRIAILLALLTAPASRGAAAEVVHRLTQASQHQVSASATWESIALLTLGDPSQGELIAVLNDRDPRRSPPAGETLGIPALALYQLAPGETLAALARRFLADGNRWPLLARLNQIENPNRLREGTKIRVPILPSTLPRTRSPAPEDASDPGPEHRERESDGEGVREKLRRATDAYMDGRYEEVRKALTALQSDVLAAGNPIDQALLLEHLTFVHVAFGDREDACKAYRALRAIEGDHRWDPVQVSPKITRVTSLCELR